jgi:hypothetical protein
MTSRELDQDQALADRCEHGMTAGDRPDPFVGGRLACPLCRAGAGATVDDDLGRRHHRAGGLSGGRR